MMKRRAALRALAGVLAGLATGAAGNAAPPKKATSPHYDWRNVPIGGGGYVLDVVCHPKEPGLVYIRTDVGGCYRFDGANKRWIPITDGFTRAESNYYGGESLALDPANPDIVYLAAGKYTAEWASAGAIFKSLDRGKTWRKLPISIKMGSNEDYRTCNPRLAVCPTRPAVLLFGSRRDGLWRSENAGESWAKVTDFPGKSRPGVGITSVAFDAAKPGVVWAAAFGDGVYRSGDYGRTWKATEGSPAEVLRLASAPGETLYATHEKGIAKWQNGRWSDATPLTETGGATGSFAGLSVNPRNAQEVIATAQKDRLHLYHSANGGASWTLKKYVTQSSVPWYPGHMTQLQYVSGLTFDPHRPGRVWLTDWYATYYADDVNADTPTFRSAESGHEEVVVFSLVAPPVGLPLLSGVADVDGFPHTSLAAFPKRGYGEFYGGTGPAFGDTYQTAWCYAKPDFLVRVSGKRWDNTGGVTVSPDGGKTWTPTPTWDAKIVPARVAVSATDPRNMVVLRVGSGAALFTRDGGASWENVRGLPDKIIHDYWNWQVPLTSDGATGGTFYVYTNSRLYRSTDGGAGFAPVGGTLAGGGQNTLLGVPGKAGALFLSLDNNGLHRSANGGETFERVPSVKQSLLFAAGKNAPGKSAPALYVYGGLADGRTGIFRSDDNGANWLTISDPHVPIGDEPNSMAASWQTFGQVFIGSNGRGVYVGAPKSVGR